MQGTPLGRLGQPDDVLGAVLFLGIRGEILSVTDIAALLRLGSVSVSDKQPPAVVIENDGAETAIVVDEIGEIADIPVESVEPPLGALDRQQASFVDGVAPVGDRLVGLIDVGRVLEPVGGSARA